MTIVVIEGVDGSGKTTLINMLRRVLPRGWIFSRVGRVKTLHEMIDYIRLLEEIPDNELAILDRHPIISESIYGPILRKGQSITSQLCGDWELGKHLSTYVQKIIYCRPSIDVIRSNLWKNPQIEGIPDNLNQLIRAYDQFMSDLKPPTTLWEFDYVNCSDERFGEMVKWIDL